MEQSDEGVFPPQKTQSETSEKQQQSLHLMPVQQSSEPSAPRSVKPDSPRLGRRSSTDVKDGTPKKPKQCNCKHSKCLKLYCECFGSGIYCDGCNCVNCHNNVDNEKSRTEAVEAILGRNPNAFRPKIASSPHGVKENMVACCRLVLRPLSDPEEDAT